MKRVVVIGAGNVAWSLAPAIAEAEGYILTQIYARNILRASELAAAINHNVAVTDDISDITDADIYIISLKDDAIGEIVDELPRNNALWVHTSGGVSIDALASLPGSRGVLYPLQTFSRGRKLKFCNIPIFIEGNTPEAMTEIRLLSESLSNTVAVADSEMRRMMHVAAVFACNFTNHLWAVATELLDENGMDFEMLRPLMEETMAKAFESGAYSGQTGPARRGDKELMSHHIDSIGSETYRNLYRLLSRSIYKMYNPETPDDEQN